MRITRFLSVVLIFGILMLYSTDANADPDAPLQIDTQSDGVHLAWQTSAASLQAVPMADSDWPTVSFGGFELPGQLLALRVSTDAPVVPQISQLTSVPWAGALTPADTPIPQTLDGEPRPDLARPSIQALPDAPIIVLREGRMRGERVIVVLISPIFTQNGAHVITTNLDAIVPGATLFDQDTASILAQSTPFLAAAPAPNNPAATVSSATIQVTQTGIQQVSGAALMSTDLDISNHTLLHLYHEGIEVALEVDDGADGALDADDQIRFFASAPTNRWNASDNYWLTAETTLGVRMTSRMAQPGSAPLRDTAYQSDIWRHNAIYDTTLPGPDGDHWFTADFKTGPGLESKSILATLQRTLPLAAGTTTLTASGSAYTAGQHQLKLDQGIMNVLMPIMGSAPAQVQLTHAVPSIVQQAVQADTSPALVVWSGIDDWSYTFTLKSIVAMVQVTLVAGGVPDGIELDSIAWRRPVYLTFDGQGALFDTDAGNWQYQLRETAADRMLYDVTDPRNPVLLKIADGTTTTFQDAPIAHRYALSGPGLLHTPEVEAHSPINLASPLNADALYIAPAAFHQALAPLVALRQQQGYAVQVVDVQAIYDSWSYGQVSPEAIRSFIRYAAATWSRVPRAVTLVGDGTIDPFNYTRSNRSGTTNNHNLIPPYVAMVDPWLGETACDTCYGLLDDDDPNDDSLPDLAIGRLPVKQQFELEKLVAKLIIYETAPATEAWRARAIYVADNYRETDGQTDGAGDFALAADLGAALQPAGVAVERMYYDPSAVGVPWREADATAAAQRTRAALNAGAGMFNFYGHSNQFQLAVTNIAGQQGPGYLLRLYDADALTNGDKLALVLQMTCLTSAFQTPAFSGTTIDERLLLAPNGGAAGVWGSSGLGVGFGHDSLQAGFYRALWQGTNPQTAVPLGTLTTAGYLTLFTEGNCCQESINTFLLLGDPLTVIRMRRES